jgi:hypothetical protein
LPRRRGQFKGEKRRKELLRLQKQEEKRKRRFSGQSDKEPETGVTDPGGQEIVAQDTGAQDTGAQEPSTA